MSFSVLASNRSHSSRPVKRYAETEAFIQIAHQRIVSEVVFGKFPSMA